MLWLLLALIFGLPSGTCPKRPFIVINSFFSKCGCYGQDYNNMIAPDREGFLEQDIRLTPDQYNNLRSQKTPIPKFVVFLWPKGVVPYEVTPFFNHVLHIRLSRRVEKAVQKISKATDGCVKFRKKVSNDVDYVLIRYGDKCYSNIGRKGGVQIMVLNVGCISEEQIQHQFIHILGFSHEHNLPYRDNHLIIHYDNVAREFCKQFKMYGHKTAPYCYDSESIMHYGTYAFTCNGKPTITYTNGKKIGAYKRRLTKLDALKIKKFYGCE